MAGMTLEEKEKREREKPLAKLLLIPPVLIKHIWVFFPLIWRISGVLQLLLPLPEEEEEEEKKEEEQEEEEEEKERRRANHGQFWRYFEGRNSSFFGNLWVAFENPQFITLWACVVCVLCVGGGGERRVGHPLTWWSLETQRSPALKCCILHSEECRVKKVLGSSNFTDVRDYLFFCSCNKRCGVVGTWTKKRDLIAWVREIALHTPGMEREAIN